MPIILVTGAAGLVGSMLRPRLARPGRTLRLLDTVPITAGPGEEAVTASVTDLGAMTQACRNAAAVVHLGGVSTEAPWPQILEVNIDGTYAVFEAARRAGVGRVVYASSNHAVGFSPRADFPVPTTRSRYRTLITACPRPRGSRSRRSTTPGTAWTRSASGS